ncbi:MAG: hypothetical protein KGL44_10250 [Sphingomonadales bacterium]|nr:hypothetical protein [Sphingomonadales bacterium]
MKQMILTAACGLALISGAAGCKPADEPVAPASPAATTAAPAKPAVLASASPTPVRPDLSQCETLPAGENEEPLRTKPLKLAPALAAIGATDMDRIAVTTLTGKTFCLDARFVGSISDQSVTPDGRFVLFGWNGYEAYGFKLIDRTGKGDAFDVGAKPVFSPSRKLIASVELSESGFGELSGFEVLAVNPTGLELKARLEDIPPLEDWRIDRWAGESCIELSGIPAERVVQTEHTQYKGIARDRYAARPSADSWTLKPAPEGCAAS